MKQPDNQLREDLRQIVKAVWDDGFIMHSESPEKYIDLFLQLFSTHMGEIIKQAKPRAKWHKYHEDKSEWYCCVKCMDNQINTGGVKQYEENLLSLLIKGGTK